MSTYADLRAEAEAKLALIATVVSSRQTYLGTRGDQAIYLEVAAQGVDKGVSGSVSYQLALCRAYVAHKGLWTDQREITDELALLVEQIQEPDFWRDMAAVYEITDQDIDTSEPTFYGPVGEQLIELTVALTP